jgi:amino acid permease
METYETGYAIGKSLQVIIPIVIGFFLGYKIVKNKKEKDILKRDIKEQLKNNNQGEEKEEDNSFTLKHI